MRRDLNRPCGADANIRKGAAAAGELGEFVFVVTDGKQPMLVLSAPRTGDAPPVTATKVGGLWVYQGKLATGTAYRYTCLVDGRAIGGTNDLAAFGPDSYAQHNGPQGKLTGPMVLESKIYPNMKANVGITSRGSGTVRLLCRSRSGATASFIRLDVRINIACWRRSTISRLRSAFLRWSTCYPTRYRCRAESTLD